MVTSFEIVLVFSEEIKTKYGYVSATESKARTKLALQSFDKKSTAHHIVGFVNWKQKAEFCSDGNQTAQTQNQSPASNANLKLNKPDATLALSNKPAPLSTKCFNCQETGHYSCVINNTGLHFSR